MAESFFIVEPVKDPDTPHYLQPDLTVFTGGPANVGGSWGCYMTMGGVTSCTIVLVAAVFLLVLPGWRQNSAGKLCSCWIARLGLACRLPYGVGSMNGAYPPPSQDITKPKTTELSSRKSNLLEPTSGNLTTEGILWRRSSSQQNDLGRRASANPVLQCLVYGHLSFCTSACRTVDFHGEQCR